MPRLWVPWVHTPGRTQGTAPRTATHLPDTTKGQYKHSSSSNNSSNSNSNTHLSPEATNRGAE